MKGYVQVYTGDGKGKTTAALGLALRAAGAGLRVLIARFMKGPDGSELAALERLGDRIEVRSFGRGDFVRGEPTAEDRQRASDGLAEARGGIESGRYDVVILDEVCVAVHLGVLPIEAVLDLLDHRPPEVELVLTGRRADPRLLERADLATEMRPLRHYYDRGVGAREGIEK